MKEQKIKSSSYKLLRLPIAIGLALGASLSYGVGLGPIQVHSHQGESLNASITITGLTSAQAKNVKVNLANNSEYAKRGVKKTPEQSKLNFRLVPTKSGYRIAVGSSGKIDESFINFVVTVSGAEEQNIVREYSAFLEKNPTDVLNNAIVEKSNTTEKKGKKSKKELAKRNAPVVEKTSDGKSRVWLDGQEVPLDNNVAASETVEEKPAKEEKTKAGAKDFSTRTDRNGQIVYTVRRGDSLARIANRFKPKSVPLDIAKQAIFNTNRHAFSGSTETSLMAGYKLTIPKDLMAAANPELAKAEEKPAEETTTANVQENVNNVNNENVAENKAETPAEKVAEKPEEKASEEKKSEEPVVAEAPKTPNLVLDSVDSVGSEEKAKEELKTEEVKTETPKVEELPTPSEEKPEEKPVVVEEPKTIEIEPIANKDDSFSSKFASYGTEIMGKIEKFINQYLPEDLAKKEIAGLPMWQIIVIGGFLALLVLLLILKAIFGKKKDDYEENLDLSKAAQDFEKEQEKLNKLEKVEPVKPKIDPSAETIMDKEESVVDGFGDADLVEAEKTSDEADFKAEGFDEGAKSQGFEEVSLKEEGFLEVSEDEEKTELSDLDLEISEQEFKEENFSAGIIAAGADLKVDKEDVIDFSSNFESPTPAEGEEDFFDELTKESEVKEDDLPEVEIEEVKTEEEIVGEFNPADFEVPIQEQEVSLDKVEAPLDEVSLELPEVEEQVEVASEEPEVEEIKEELSTAPSIEEFSPAEPIKAPVAEIPAEEVKAENKAAKLVSPNFSIDLPTPKTKAEVVESIAPSVEEVMAKVEEVSSKVVDKPQEISNALTDFPADSDEALTLGAEDLSNSAGDFVSNDVKSEDLFNTSDEPFNSAAFSAPEESAVGEEDNKNLAQEEPITHELSEMDSFDIDLNGNDLVPSGQPVEENFSDIPVSTPSSNANDAPFNEADIGAMAINLELATAYVNAGIKLDKAKAWLEEVLQRGADIQKQKARDLMEELNKKL